MKHNPLFILCALAATTVSSNGALVWTVGTDDDVWQTNGVAGGPVASFLQENGTINPLPGNFNSSSSANAGGTPTPPAGQERPDNDYYLAGIYATAVPANGSYTPVGIVSTDELAAERAFAGGDLSLRYHFNMPAGFNSASLLTVGFDALNLDSPGAVNTDPRFGVEIWLNGIRVMEQVIIRPAQLGFDYTSTPISIAAANVGGPGTDNIVELRGISYNGAGGGNWMGVDYVRLDVTPIPEPGSGAMVLLGALGCSAFFGRRRSGK